MQALAIYVDDSLIIAKKQGELGINCFLVLKINQPSNGSIHEYQDR